MKVQLNHPGSQKPFKLNKGYKQEGSKIIREHNSDKQHYRKFLQVKGHYINGLKDTQSSEAELYFWGEWEGASYFTPFNSEKVDFRILPNGVHKPFCDPLKSMLQNTDPYVYGECFKYCVCKQTGQVQKLISDDIILFGTVVPSLGKFYIDTVFVVKDFELSSKIQATSGEGYSEVYKTETLNNLNEYLKSPFKQTNHRIFHSKTWWDDKDYFSFVPCKLDSGASGFERLYISLDNEVFKLSKNPTGKSFLKECVLNPKELWQEIVNLCAEQGFKLGIRFQEPQLGSDE